MPDLHYSARDVADLLGVSVGQIRSFARAGLLAPGRGPRGELRFSFQDLVLLRTAVGLVSDRLPALRVRRALRKLRDRHPGQPLSGVQLAAAGSSVVVRDGDVVWSPESGQTLFDFDPRTGGGVVAAIQRPDRAAPEPAPAEPSPPAEEWYLLGCDLEDTAPAEAAVAYRRAVELDPAHASALINLGRLLHLDGDPGGAAAHYQRALEARPGDAVAEFNLGVALEDQGRTDDAIAAYQRAVAAEPDTPDPHYNLARLFERLGQRTAALRHLRTYRKLTQGR